MASMPSTVCAGSSSAVSRVPGPPPRISTLAATGRSNTTAVTPEPSLSSWAWPTWTPATSVIRLRMRSPEYHIGAIPVSRTLPWPWLGGHTRPMHDVTVYAALLAGIVSFLSPCVLPLVPPYLVFLAGTSLERFADREPQTRVRWETVGAACLFVLGFSTVFVALGASASVIGSLIRAYSEP